VIYRLRVLWALLTGGLPPRCSGCRRYIVGAAYSSSMTAPVDKPEYRHYPDCPPAEYADRTGRAGRQ